MKNIKMKYICQNCGRIFKKGAIKPLTAVFDLDERLVPGDVVPSGECLECGALVYQYVRPLRVVFGQTPQVMKVLNFKTDGERDQYLAGLSQMNKWLGGYEAEIADENGLFPPINGGVVESLIKNGGYTKEDLSQNIRKL